MKIKLEYNNLTITIEATTVETTLDAMLAGTAVLEALKREGHGNPKFEWDMSIDVEKTEKDAETKR